MQYELRHFDTPLLRFTATENSRFPEVRITWRGEASNLLPLDLEPTDSGLQAWLCRRTLPKNRAYVHSFLSKCGLSLNRPMGILRVSKGLSLNDCYWVVEEGFPGTFAQYNLYDNRFSKVLALIAFTGYGSSVRSSLASCPEFTTNGMLPKCWRRESGAIKLYKGGTSGASNTGFEPYSEFYAPQVARVMGISAIDYTLSRWQGQLCSVCTLFTSKDFAFLPAGRLVKTGGMEAVRRFCTDLGPSFRDALDDMLVLDALICNTDRHFGNFGFLVDTRRNQITAPAPLFDHGNALCSLAGRDAFQSADALGQYAETLLPCVYDGFLDTAKAVLTPRRREGLRRLLTFRFKKHPRYNLPPQRLKLLEALVRDRAQALLDS